jgi:hypothetical protein
MNLKHISKLKFRKFIYLYTIWAFVLHILYLNGYIGNTFPIALFVFVCSQILVLINPIYPYYLPFELFFHFLPLFIIPVSFEHVDYLVLSFIAYLIIVNSLSFNIYINLIKFLKQ